MPAASSRARTRARPGARLTGLAHAASPPSPSIPSRPAHSTRGRYGDGVFKSTDAGATWSAANAGLPNTSVDALAIDPITPQTLYAGTVATASSRAPTVAAPGTLSTLASPTPSSTRSPSIRWSRAGCMPGRHGGGVFAIEQVPPSCVGDCEGADTVAINDLITLVNIALGTAQPSACPNGGLPLGGEVDVAVIIQAVNNALNGCSDCNRRHDRHLEHVGAESSSPAACRHLGPGVVLHREYCPRNQSGNSESLTGRTQGARRPTTALFPELDGDAAWARITPTPTTAALSALLAPASRPALGTSAPGDLGDAD